MKKCPISRTNIFHFETIVLYQNVSYKMVRTERIELSWEAHTPLKRARLPIPPRPQNVASKLYIIFACIARKKYNKFMDKRTLLTIRQAKLPNDKTIDVKVYLKTRGRSLSARANYGQLELYVFRATSLKSIDKLIQDGIKHFYPSHVLDCPFYKEEQYVYLFGRRCELTRDSSKKNDPMYFYLSPLCKDPIVKYKKIFSEYVNQRVPILAKWMGIDITGFRFRTGLFISYFGCCFPKKKIIKFDYRLLAYSPELIDSIFYHELTHIFELRHTKRFYAILNSYCHGYNAKQKEVSRGHFEGRLNYDA